MNVFDEEHSEDEERWRGGRLTKRRSKIVIDTGVLISAFAFDGAPDLKILTPREFIEAA